MSCHRFADHGAILSVMLSMMADDVDAWCRHVLGDSHIFGGHYIGYWAFGVYTDTDADGWPTWLVYDRCDDNAPGEDSCLFVEGMFHRGEPLPPRWHVLDKSVAEVAFIAGILRWGADWFDAVDATKEDIVLQLALLGDIKYS